LAGDWGLSPLSDCFKKSSYRWVSLPSTSFKTSGEAEKHKKKKTLRFQKGKSRKRDN
jgi:hypothetical protein